MVVEARKGDVAVLEGGRLRGKPGSRGLGQGIGWNSPEAEVEIPLDKVRGGGADDGGVVVFAGSDGGGGDAGAGAVEGDGETQFDYGERGWDFGVGGEPAGEEGMCLVGHGGSVGNV